MSPFGEHGGSKRALRSRVRAIRCALDSAACAAHAEAVADRLVALPELTDATTVLAYWPTAEELDTRPAIESLHGLGKVVALPRVEGPGVLGIHEFLHADGLECGAYGIMQPPSEAPRLDALAIDAVLVPGVAFDRAGHRLGYGGGYYDRLLPSLRRDCLRVGLAYDEQVVDELPAEEHDVRLHAVVTPTRLLRFDR